MAQLTIPDWMFERDSSPEPLPPPEPPSANSLSIPDEAFAASTAYAMDPTLPLGPNDWDEVDRANAARVDELNNEFIDLRDGILHDGDDAFFNRTGRDAVLAAPQVHARLEAAREETLGRAANDVQRDWLRETLGKHKIVEHFDIGDHVGRQSVAWQKSINRGRLDRLNRQAGRDHGDPKMVEALANASESSARDHARASGLRPDSPEAQAEVDIARSSVFRHAIEAALAKGAHSTAIKLHDRVRDKLVPGDAEFLDKIIEDTREMKIGKDYVAKIAPLSLTINTSLEDLDKAQGEAIAKNNEDWKDNEPQRAANQHFINVRFGKAKRQVEMDKAKLTQTVHDWLTTPGPDGLLQTERPPFVIWGKLTEGERKEVDTVLEMNAREPMAADNAIHSSGNQDHVSGLNVADLQFLDDLSGDPDFASDALPEPMEEGREYAQNVGPPRRGPTRRTYGTPETLEEATRISNYEAYMQRLAKLDPSHRMLTRVTTPGWIPTRAQEREAQNTVSAVLARIRSANPSFEAPPSIPRIGHNSEAFSEQPVGPRRLVRPLPGDGRPLQTFRYEWAPFQLDPENLNKKIPQAELDHIGVVLERIVSGNLEGLYPHPYTNYPNDRTGAVLPPSIKGYTSIDVPNSELDRGMTRIMINRDNGAIYYTNKHSQSFYPIRLSPPSQ